MGSKQKEKEVVGSKQSPQECDDVIADLEEAHFTKDERKARAIIEAFHRARREMLSHLRLQRV